MRFLGIVAVILLIIGGINWGLVGIANFNLVDYLFAETFIDRIIYVLVGLSALVVAFRWNNVVSAKR